MYSLVYRPPFLWKQTFGTFLNKQYQTNQYVKAKGVEQSGLARRKHFQQENSRDTEHGKPNFRFGKVRKSSEAR
jgi:hypothetical protein